MKPRTLLSIIAINAAIVIAFLLGVNLASILFPPPANMSIQELNAQLLLNQGSSLELLFDSEENLADAIYIRPGTDIQSVVDNAPNSAVFIIGAGVHRLQNITPGDGDIFIGEDGAILNGANVITGFEAEEAYWVSADPVLAIYEPIDGGICREGFERCNHPYDLYLDDQPFTHVSSIDDVRDGTWFFDYEEDRAYIGTNPIDRTVEISTQFHAFTGEAQDVVIEHLTIEKYGGYGQLGAIRAQDGSNWTISDNVVRLNSGAGITFGNDMLIANNRVIQNGQIGVSGEGDNVIVTGNEIAYNNYAQYDPGWEAGGTKFVATSNLIVRNNYVHHNDGPGLWTDIDNFNTLYEYNLVLYNNGSGILHEISYDAVIRHNVLRYNLDRDVSVYLGGQIALSSSGNVEVYGNDVVTGSNGGHAIVVVQQDRGRGRLGEHHARNNHIYDNHVVFLNDIGETAAATDIEDIEWFWRENTFENNQYFGSLRNLALWGWRDTNLDWSAFNEQVEPTGSYSTTIPLQALNSPSWQTLQMLSAQQD